MILNTVLYIWYHIFGTIDGTSYGMNSDIKYDTIFGALDIISGVHLMPYSVPYLESII